VPGEDGFNKLKQQCGFSDQEIEDFRVSFFRSGKGSVDAFLEYRSDFMRIGKAAIAFNLISREDETKLFGFDPANWLREVAARLDAPFERYHENKVSFITFNYDRSVEHFLFNVLKNTHKKPDSDVAEVLRDIPIIHLHGRLGYLPWQTTENNRRNYETNFEPGALDICIENIKIIHEDITDVRDADFQLAKRLLTEAEQVVILGFGYGRTNVERLDLASLAKGKAIGTCQGLGPRGTQFARECCNDRVGLIGGDCMHFVREVVRWS
jgi:hypothetical protein